MNKIWILLFLIDICYCYTCFNQKAVIPPAFLPWPVLRTRFYNYYYDDYPGYPCCDLDYIPTYDILIFNEETHQDTTQSNKPTENPTLATISTFETTGALSTSTVVLTYESSEMSSTVALTEDFTTIVSTTEAISTTESSPVEVEITSETLMTDFEETDSTTEMLLSTEWTPMETTEWFASTTESSTVFSLPGSRE